MATRAALTNSPAMNAATITMSVTQERASSRARRQNAEAGNPVTAICTPANAPRAHTVSGNASAAAAVISTLAGTRKVSVPAEAPAQDRHDLHHR